MNELPAALSEIFFRLQGSPILDYNLGQKALRLLIQTKVAQLLNTGGDTLNLVLEGCSQLYYLSFTQTLETRTRQYQSEDIFKKGLVIQGIEFRPSNHYIIFCNSFLNTVEAGELHLTCQNFQLYDQAFGSITYTAFCEASDKIKKYR